MSEQQTIDALNENTLEFVKMLGGRITALDIAGKSCTMEFDVGKQFCHSVDVIQGGFVTAMLDMAMSHCAFGIDKTIANVSSLEIKTSYLEPTRAGHLRCVGTIVKAGYKVAFMEGHLYNDQGQLTATASSVGKLIRA
ncbi:MAG: PaaI family thioesterase [Halioglobus sp.]